MEKQTSSDAEVIEQLKEMNLRERGAGGAQFVVIVAGGIGMVIGGAIGNALQPSKPIQIKTTEGTYTGTYVEKPITGMVIGAAIGAIVFASLALAIFVSYMRHQSNDHKISDGVRNEPIASVADTASDIELNVARTSSNASYFSTPAWLGLLALAVLSLWVAYNMSRNKAIREQQDQRHTCRR